MKISPIMRKASLPDGGTVLFLFCPGCKDVHGIRVGTPERPCWTWNGDALKPTFQPSLLCTSGHHVAGQPQPPNCRLCNHPEVPGQIPFCQRCHTFITDGQIQFLADCSHELAGQTVPIPDFPYPVGEYGGVEPIELP